MTEYFTIEDRNYYNDPRVRARESKWWAAINERLMLAHVADPEDVPEEHQGKELWVAFQYVTCNICGGKGAHVNPSIDCGGLTSDDFAEDPGFLEDYMAGRYDVECYLCNGQRVVPQEQADGWHKWIEPEVQGCE